MQASADKLPTNCLSVIDHFVGLALKVLRVAMLSYFSDSKTEIKGKIAKGYSESGRTSKLEIFCDDSGFLAVNYFRKKGQLEMFIWVLNLPLNIGMNRINMLKLIVMKILVNSFMTEDVII